MSDFRCPTCNKYLSKVRATVKGLGEPEYIESVHGTCNNHGRVEAVGDYAWEDFYPEEVYPAKEIRALKPAKGERE